MKWVAISEVATGNVVVRQRHHFPAPRPPLPDMTLSLSAWSPCGKYRYLLAHEWDASRRPLAVIGLNPSTATEIDMDPTVHRCCIRALQGNYGGLTMLNLFPLVSTDPRGLNTTPDRGDAHPEYGTTMDAGLRAAGDVLVAWGGIGGAHLDAVASVMQRIRAFSSRLPLCLGMTAAGDPRHPLYIAYETPMRPYEPMPVPVG